MDEKPVDKTKGKVTLKAVAQHAGVSISTASRALSGATGISTSVRDKIFLAAKELNYLNATTTARQITILSDIETVSLGAGDYMQDVMEGLHAECRDLGIEPKIQLIDSRSSATLVERSKNHLTDGYVLLSILDDKIIDELVAHKIPAVIINGVDRMMRIDAVAPANRAGGHMATDHLIELGHKQILNFTHDPRLTIQDRLLGYTDAMKSANLEVKDEFIVSITDMRTDIGYLKMKEILQLRGHGGFTAVICCNDAVAIGVSTAILEAGLHVPEDISIVGFDNIATAAISSPPLTTIAVDRYVLGSFGIQRLAERVRAPKNLPTYTQFTVKIEVRKSTGPVRDK
uniref:HTH lacI-type domain-containing protein n=1 Tax=OCS116 cluster bacterium TaxID=2030921 RepID=A0A2A4ZB42_9PROT